MAAATRPTRVAADLLEAAVVVAKFESRSATQQLDHWARIGQNVSMHETVARRLVEAALAGDLAPAELSSDEQAVVNAELDVAIAERCRGHLVRRPPRRRGDHDRRGRRRREPRRLPSRRDTRPVE